MIGYRGDKNLVLKVYFLNDDKKVELFFRKKYLKYVWIECVYIKKKEMFDKIEILKFYEEKVFVIDVLIIKELKKII